MTDSPVLTRDEAQALCDALSLPTFFESDEEVDLLEEHNPTLLQAYETVRAIADGDEA